MSVVDYEHEPAYQLGRLHAVIVHAIERLPKRSPVRAYLVEALREYRRAFPIAARPDESAFWLDVLAREARLIGEDSLAAALDAGAASCR